MGKIIDLMLDEAWDDLTISMSSRPPHQVEKSEARCLFSFLSSLVDCLCHCHTYLNIVSRKYKILDTLITTTPCPHLVNLTQRRQSAKEKCIPRRERDARPASMSLSSSYISAPY